MYITTPQTLECLISNRDIKTDNYTQTKIVDISKFCINRIISSFWLAVAFSDQKLLKISFFLHLCNASMETFCSLLILSNLLEMKSKCEATN